MKIEREHLPFEVHEKLKEYVYDVIGAMHEVYNHLGNGLPEYVYQEALYRELCSVGYEPQKELQQNLVYKNTKLDSYVKMDLVVPKEEKNIIIECKSISTLTEKEQFQTWGYMTATQFPVAILVNFGSYPKAQIQRYCIHDGKIYAF